MNKYTEFFTITQLLALAVESEFISREQARAIWKTELEKYGLTKKEVEKNGTR